MREEVALWVGCRSGFESMIPEGEWEERKVINLRFDSLRILERGVACDSLLHFGETLHWLGRSKPSSFHEQHGQSNHLPAAITACRPLTTPIFRLLVELQQSRRRHPWSSFDDRNQGCLLLELCNHGDHLGVLGKTRAYAQGLEWYPVIGDAIHQ